jgi:GNAT superfamily N-acetyltransferase
MAAAFEHNLLYMENTKSVEIRLLVESDPPSIAVAFANIGWNKPEPQYRRYLHEQVAGTRTCFVAIADGQFAGYVTVNWQPTYAGFIELNIPEIQDLNVLTSFRRKGIASHLLDRAEGEAARHSSVVGIAVGLHPGYNAAQRLYVKRGYIPDARGIMYRNRFVEEGASVVVDDDLVMHFTKQLAANRDDRLRKG